VAARLIAAEESIYEDADDVMVNWSDRDLATAFAGAGLDTAIAVETEATELRVTRAVIDRWFGSRSSGRPSYGQRVAATLSEDEVAQVESLFRRQLGDQTITWHTQTAYVNAQRVR
jgi:hypothetical protein